MHAFALNKNSMGGQAERGSGGRRGSTYSRMCIWIYIYEYIYLVCWHCSSFGGFSFHYVAAKLYYITHCALHITHYKLHIRHVARATSNGGKLFSCKLLATLEASNNYYLFSISRWHNEGCQQLFRAAAPPSYRAAWAPWQIHFSLFDFCCKNRQIDFRFN